MLNPGNGGRETTLPQVLRTDLIIGSGIQVDLEVQTVGETEEAHRPVVLLTAVAGGRIRRIREWREAPGDRTIGTGIGIGEKRTAIQDLTSGLQGLRPIRISHVEQSKGD